MEFDTRSDVAVNTWLPKYDQGGHMSKTPLGSQIAMKRYLTEGIAIFRGYVRNEDCTPAHTYHNVGHKQVTRNLLLWQ